MDSDQLNQYRMAGEVDTLLGERAAALAPSTVAVQEAADVRAAYAALGRKLGGTTSTTQEVTETAGTQRAELERLLPALTGPLQSHARKTNNTDLLAAATLRSKQLEKMRPPQLRDLVGALLDHATTHAAALAPYGFTAAVRTRFDAALATFAGTVGATQGLLDKRQATNATADELLRELLQQLYELDQPMEIFRALDPRPAPRLPPGPARGRGAGRGYEQGVEAPVGVASEQKKRRRHVTPTFFIRVIMR